MKDIVVVGSVNLDLVVSAARAPEAGETLLGTQFATFPGGKGANQAVAVARLGHPVRMVGKLGSDLFSAQLMEALEAAGVNTEAVGKTPGHSGVAFIVTVESGENSIIVVPGANSLLLSEDMEENRRVIGNAGMVLTQMETPLATAEALAEIAFSSGVPLMLDPTPACYLPAELLRKVAWITPNESEAQLLAGSTSSPTSEPELRELAEYFLGLGPENVLLKLGERGAYVATGDGIRALIPAYTVRAVDTTAAGDAFNGAFAVALVRGHSALEAAHFASAVAAISRDAAGCAAGDANAAGGRSVSRERASGIFQRPPGVYFMKKIRAALQCVLGLSILASLAAPGTRVFAQSAASVSAAQKIILDTDIGDDIDDAFALGLAVSRPGVQLMGVTTAWGDTNLRARLAERLLTETGHSDIRVFAGPKTLSSNVFTQARWASAFPEPEKGWPDAVDFILDTVRKNPGQITLISIAPFSNVGALIDKDPATFRKLKRVIVMGGSIHRGYGDLGLLPNHGPSAEYNVAMDVPAAKKLFASGVPLYVMPLDSTQLKMDVIDRNALFSQGTALTDALTLLYHQWTASTHDPTPTLYDAMAVAFAIEPSLCPTRPMHIAIDDKGYTRVEPGEPNANVCLNSDSDRFFHFYIPAVLAAPAR